MRTKIRAQIQPLPEEKESQTQMTTSEHYRGSVETRNVYTFNQVLESEMRESESIFEAQSNYSTHSTASNYLTPYNALSSYVDNY